MNQATTARREWMLSASYATLALAVTGGLVAMTWGSWPSPVAVLVFATLVVFAENGSIQLPSRVRVSPTFTVIMAAIAAFGGEGVYVGVAAIGVCCGVTRDHLRKRKVAQIVINSAVYVLASQVGAATYATSEGAHPLLRVLVTGAAFGAVNAGLVLVAVAILFREPADEIWADMYPALPNYLAFGLVGLVIGQLYVSLGALTVVLLVTPIAIARSTYRAFLELNEAQEATLRVFLRAIAAKDEYTARHTERVCEYSVYIGEKLGMTHARLEHLRRSALMHDIGKLAVPKHLLNKPAKLTDEEFLRVQRHAHVCVDILELIDFLRPLTAAAAGHHARYDGGGYGGTGERPIEAYVVAVADAFDAMTSTRAYRRALPMETAFAELRAQAGTQFHPACVEALIAAITERGQRHGLGHERDEVSYEVSPPVVGVGSAGLGDRSLDERRANPQPATP